jgi:hypothetical protein
MRSHRDIFFVAITALTVLIVVLFGQRIYRQVAPVEIVVPERAPLPAVFSNALSGTGSTALTNYFAPIPYERAADKRVSPSDIRAIRVQLAWNFIVPQRPTIISIESSNVIVVDCEVDESHSRSFRFEKVHGSWRIVESTTGVY